MMQAIAETLFDIVYLVSVITIGVLMIRGCKGERQFRLFGWMAVVLGAGDAFHLIPRAFALCTTHHDRVLCAAVLRLAAALPGAWPERPDRRRVRPGWPADRPVHDAAEPLDERRRASQLGDLAQHPLCPSTATGRSAGCG